MAGSNNFLQWNPGAVNQEDDPTYQGDAQRVGGAINGQIFNDVLANKLFYQLSTFVAAFGAMMANKGYAMSDANITTLQTVLQNIFTNADMKQSLQVIGFSTNITVNCGVANGFQISMFGDTTISQINASPGQEVTFMFIQDGVGGHDVTWTYPGFVSGPSISTDSSSVSVVTFFTDSSGYCHPKVAGAVVT